MTNMNNTPSFSGIYGIPEVARYLAVSPPLTNGYSIPTDKLRYWIRTSVPYISPMEYPTSQRFITFLDLVSMRMVAILRARGVRLKEIRNAEYYLRKYFGLEWPLANRELWTYGSDIFIQFGGYLLDASRFGQQAMDFLRDWLREVEPDMTFDQSDLASSWSPYKGIRLNPKVQFGEPCMDGTRIPTHAIWSSISAGDSIEAITILYDLDIAKVIGAIQWEKRIEAVLPRGNLRNR